MVPLDCLAQAVYYEARGESRSVQEAVAQVVRNRGSKNYCKTVYNGCQFTWVCKAHEPPYGYSWIQAKRVAHHARFIPDTTGGATHFHSGPPPYWAKSLTHTTTIGPMEFYR
jgi:spore germination cell wall hydrolase CwlJ-like protein